MKKSIYLLKPHPVATPIDSTHSTIVIHTLNFAQVKSMDDNCGEWVESMGVATGCGLRRYIDFFILLIPTPLVSVLFAAASLLFCSFFKMFFVLVPVLFKNYILGIKQFFHTV